MNSTEWNGKKYLDLMNREPMACQILSQLIENSALTAETLQANRNTEKVTPALRKLQEHLLIETSTFNRHTVIWLSSACYQPSWRAALGGTPGHRWHKFPELRLYEAMRKSRRSLCCGLARGAFLSEWHRGLWKETIGCLPQEGKVRFPKEECEMGALQVIRRTMRGKEESWILFDPLEERTTLQEQLLLEWIEKRKAEKVILFQEKMSEDWTAAVFTR